MITRTSSVRLSTTTPPTSFRLFVAGWNETTKGSFLFDAAAAEQVMAAYREHGVDLAIDLEHQMLDDVPSPDPSARDARGWCGLELRPDGSLWAVRVRWTEDGAARLAAKTQRYVSPAFEVDTATMRVTQIVNVAITAMPATHETPALVAANQRNTNMQTAPKKKPIDARRTMRLAAEGSPGEKKLAAIAKILGLEEFTVEEIHAAINALAKPEEEALGRLSQREIDMCRAKGVSPAAYLARRLARGAIHAARR